MPKRRNPINIWITLVLVAVIAFVANVPPFDKLKGTKVEAARPGGTYEQVNFDTLGSYEYEAKKGGSGKPLPETVTKLDDKKVAVEGFMVPVDMDKEGVTSFVLVKDQMMCCYGATPKMNQWIFVSVDQKTPPLMDQPITVYGQLEVGEDIDETGEVISLYRMAAEKIEQPKGI